MKMKVKKLWLCLCLLTMLAGGTATAQQTELFQKFIAKHSLSFSYKSCGKKMGAFSLREDVSSFQLASRPYLLLFWAMDGQGKQTLQRVDSLRRKGALGCPVIAVNTDADPAAVETYVQERHYRFPVIAGPEAVRFAKRQKALEGKTLVVVDAEGKVHARWDNLSWLDLLRWVKVSTWYLTATEEDYSFESLTTCLKTGEYGRGLYIAEQLDWSDLAALESYWQTRLSFLTWSGNDGVLPFAEEVYTRLSEKHKADEKARTRMVYNLADLLSYTGHGGESFTTSPDICRYTLRLYDELLKQDPQYGESFVVTDRIRIMHDQLGTGKARCRELAEKAMEQAKRAEAEGLAMHPATYNYLQEQIDKYK